MEQGGDVTSDAGQPEAVTDLPETPERAGGADAVAIARGVRRWLAEMGCYSLLEVTLANGRRADVLAVDRHGGIAIVEIKSSVADFRADQKWPDYREFCDRFWFAVGPAFPSRLIPADCGLLVADAYGAEPLRAPPEHRLNPARRRALTLSIAHTAMGRLHRIEDPWLGG